MYLEVTFTADTETSIIGTGKLNFPWTDLPSCSNRGAVPVHAAAKANLALPQMVLSMQ